MPGVPWWLRSGSWHTVVGGLPLRGWCVRRRSTLHQAPSESVVLDAGGGIALTGVYTRGTGDDLVIFIHGWEGSAESAYLLSAADAVHRAGCSVFRLQLRDHGDSHALNEGPFLGSEHAEVLAAVGDVQRRFAASRTSVVGFSLGGNFAVRLAAHGAAAGVSIDRVIAVCPPIRPGDAARAISASRLYNGYFSRRWKRSIRFKMAHFPRWRAHRALLDIDDIIAMHEAFVPLYTDFANADAYFDSYALTASNLGSLDCPTELILAADDPVCPVASARRLARLPGISCTVIPHGGHCAFLDGITMTSWLDQYLVQALKASV